MVAILLLLGCGNTRPPEKQLSLSDARAAFTAAGMQLGENQEKAFALLQASDGAAFEVNGHQIEIYVFATDIASGREALTRLQREGLMGRRALTSRNLALAENAQHPDWEQIRTTFVAMSQTTPKPMHEHRKATQYLEVKGLHPTHGDAGGGDIIRLLGHGFTSSPRSVKVYFGDRAANVLRFTSDNEVLVETPSGRPGTTVNVTVTFEPGGETAMEAAFRYD